MKPELISVLLEWGPKNYVNYPWRSTTNLFHGLIAEVMLQRTKAEQVIPVFNRFVEESTRMNKGQIDEEKLSKILEPLGLEWRIAKIIELTNVILEIGYVPIYYDELVKLPGVGDYAASAFLSFHAGVSRSIIDSNVVRLYGRLLGIKTDNSTRRKKWFIELVNMNTPVDKHKEYNYAVLDYSKSICLPKPRCSICLMKTHCNYYTQIQE